MIMQMRQCRLSRSRSESRRVYTNRPSTNQVTKHVEIPQTLYTDKVLEVPSVKLRQVLQVQTGADGSLAGAVRRQSGGCAFDHACDHAGASGPYVPAKDTLQEPISERTQTPADLPVATNLGDSAALSTAPPSLFGATSLARPRRLDKQDWLRCQGRRWPGQATRVGQCLNFARMNDDALVLRFADSGQSPNVRH